MIIGSGLLANAFFPAFGNRQDVCIYAAGVSNSNCDNAKEFAREGHRLEEALRHADFVDAFVYFGTCSVADPGAVDTPYVRHKLAMEYLVRSFPRNLILRLPNVAGRTPNPHTLLNFLYARIARGESFALWGKAKRNVIDIDDVAGIAREMIEDRSARRITRSIANSSNYSLLNIVQAMESVVGKKGVFDVVEKGHEYPIETSSISHFVRAAGVEFGADYLTKVLVKYYKKVVNGYGFSLT